MKLGIITLCFGIVTCAHQDVLGPLRVGTNELGRALDVATTAHKESIRLDAQYRMQVCRATNMELRVSCRLDAVVDAFEAAQSRTQALSEAVELQHAAAAALVSAENDCVEKRPTCQARQVEALKHLTAVRQQLGALRADAGAP